MSCNSFINLFTSWVVVPAAVLDDPVMTDPEWDDPVLKDPVLDVPVLNDPVLDDPVLNEPVLDDPDVEEPGHEPVVLFF